MSTSFRIFLAIAVTLGAGTYWLLDKLSERIERQYMEAAEELMIDAAHLLASVAAGHITDTSSLSEALQGAHRRRFYAEVYHVTKTEVGMHVYVTDASGIVLLDTRDAGNVGKDFSVKRDVFLTLKNTYGARSTRLQEDDDQSSVMYVGAPVLDTAGNTVGVLTVSKPQAAMFEFMGASRAFNRRMALLFASFVLVTIALALNWFTRPIDRLVAYAQSVQRGQRPSLKRSRNPEAAALGDAIEDMRHALEDRKYVETYVQTLTHEMKSPVAGIRGAAELLADPSMPEAQRRRFLTNIQNETTRLQNSIDRLLALSAIEGRTALEKPRRIDLAALVTRTADNHSESLAAKKVTLDLQLADTPTIRGEEFILEMAISNLLQNATDFAPKGTTITVALNTDKTAGTTTLTITDAGPGIPDYALDRVFDRFYSLQHPDTGKKSSGLGLCFVKEAAHLHAGTATLTNNNPPPGATATLSLPTT